MFWTSPQYQNLYSYFLFLFYFKGRAGADGSRGMPGESGSKVQMLLHNI